MALPKTQKAIVLHAVGSPVVLEERPVPEPGEGQLLVKVTVAGCEFFSLLTGLTDELFLSMVL